MNRLWTRATKILYSDRIACLSFKRHANEALLIRNLQEQTANKFRELFASTFWNMKLVVWLHNTLIEHTNESYKTIYVESLKILKHKVCLKLLNSKSIFNYLFCFCRFHH